jgi:hypothetical protein
MPSRRKLNTKEVIGRTDLLAYLDYFRPSSGFSWDTTRPDYEWWDKFRRGMQPGYELASRLVAPISKIRSVWALGDGLEFRLRANMDLERITYTNEQLKEWSASIRSLLATLLRDLDELGDQYTATLRTIAIKNITSATLDTMYGTIESQATLTLEYDNPLGVIPVTSFHGRRSANETNGRVVYADDILLLSRYDDLTNKGIDAAALMGTPIPVWSNVTDVEEEKAALETETGHLDAEGNAETAIDFDPNAGIITTGNFDFKSPGAGFTQDIRDMLKLLFLLILEEHQIPETVWGGELGQARATSVEQMKTFHAMIEGFRTDLEGTFAPDKGRIEGLQGLVSVWLRTKALTDKKLVVDALALDWPALAMMDEKLMFEKVKYLGDTGRLSDVTVVDVLDVVEDPEGEVEKAKAEIDANRDPFDADIDEGLADEDDGDPEEDADIDDEAA